ncbi:chaperone NapD [Hansschlegelia zhihuaiae]|uniref:Chaperone NapD n=1 Tax=Hansschlegelia zhihuaiae TaxID=405005 RepID=A0A4Q0MC53_9HYPH|nr:chaperone NapD [Hansschlegelia zhihuaiae]RXF70901.1 nitrate reductase formation protein NapD [Hansschlegelia zhihuaiae]
MTGAAAPRLHHISSAVVSTLPERVDSVLLQIEPLPDVEVHRVEGGKIVVVLEGANVGEIGSRLVAIGLIDGVLSANLVFEQIEELDDPGVDP